MTEAATADRLQAKVGGVCLIAAPTLMAISTFLRYDEDMRFTMYDGNLRLGMGIVLMGACTLYIPATLALARLLWGRAPRLAVFGGALGILGCAGGVNIGSFAVSQWAARTAGADAATVRAIAQVADGQLGPLFYLTGPMYPLALLALSVGLFRTGVVARWEAVLIGLGALCFALGRIPEIPLLYHVADALLLIPLASIGLRHLAEAVPGRAAVPATA